MPSSDRRNVHARRFPSLPAWMPGVVLGVACGALLVTGTTVFFGPPSSPRPDDANVLQSTASWALRTFQMTPPFWRQDRRIVAVVIENHLDARPHLAGLERALAVDEFVVEAGITRFVAYFDIDDLPERIGPVRSLRPYFVDASRPWTTVILHAGGSPEAFEHADAVDDLIAINALKYQFEEYFMRDNDIPAPHNLFTDGEHVRALLSGRAIPSVRWPPYGLGAPNDSSGATLIHMRYGSTTHDVSYAFDHASGRYERQSTDAEPVYPRNLLILEMPITGVGEHGRLTIPVEGSGGLLLFRDGQVSRGTWSKDDGEDFVFADHGGSAMRFSTGQTWMAVIPDLEKVTWE